MKSKILFAIILVGIAGAASAQQPLNLDPAGINTSTLGNGSTSTPVQTDPISSLGSTTSTTSGGGNMIAFGKARPPVVTPEPVTMLAFLPGLLFFAKRKKATV